MTGYWIRHRALLSIFLSAVISVVAGLLFVFPFISQIADNYNSQSVYKNTSIDFIAPDEFNNIFDKARLIISHAGMGTILSALQKGKPIIVFPRIAAMGEHRNEHQMATARKFKELGSVNVAMNEEELKAMLLNGEQTALQHIGNSASPSLIQSIEEFIDKV